MTKEQRRAAWAAGMAVEEVPPAPRVIPPAQEQLLLGRQRRLMLFFLGLWVGGGALYYHLVFDELKQDLAFQLSDVERVEGEVAAQERTSNSINGTKTTRIRYRYTLDGASHRGAHETVDRELIARLPPGTPTEIEVARAYPWASRLPGKESSFFGLPANLVFLAMVLLMPPSAHFATRLEARRRRRLLESGTPAAARVTKRGATGGKNKRYYADYTFSVGGRSYEGRVSSGSEGHLAEMAARDELVIVHDPRDPSKNTLWGLARAPARS